MNVSDELFEQWRAELEFALCERQRACPHGRSQQISKHTQTEKRTYCGFRWVFVCRKKAISLRRLCKLAL
jgi:hypothetical protein